MTLEIAQQFAQLLGENSPVVPTSAEQFNQIPMFQREIIRKAMPGFVQSLLANPESLPAAVYVRYKEGKLIHSDLPALRAAGLDFDAQALEAKNRTDEVGRMIAELEQQRRDNFVPEEHKRANEAEERRLRLASMNKFSRI